MKKIKRIFKQEKLWRDKTPQIHRDRGSTIHVKSLNDAEYDHQLRLKLIEEAEEVQEARSSEHLQEEIADVLEVIVALMKLHGINQQELTRVQDEKRLERGGFYERQYVTHAEHEVGSVAEQYCSQELHKYPIIEE